MRSLLLLFHLLALQPGFTQISHIRKCSPSLAAALHSRDDKTANTITVVLVVDNYTEFILWGEQEGVSVINSYPSAGVLILSDRLEHFTERILPRPEVVFADLGHAPGIPELLVPGHNLFVNSVSAARSRFPEADGRGITVSVKEFRFDSADVDFLGRHISNPASALTVDPHATLMTTLVGGAGNAATSGAGAAPGCRLVSSSFIGLLPDADADYETYDISVQNHSYGTGIENYYGASALAYDVSTQLHPDLLHVFSAGNLGTSAPSYGTYADLKGWANLSGNFKMAKNILTVGAVDSFYRVLPFSSRGPAFDGRLKPDLVAFGQDGSSGAAALVSGAAAVIQQSFYETYGAWPTSALLRAILIGAADDLDAPGPDFTTGYGNLNLRKALQIVTDRFMGFGSIEQGDSVEFVIQVPADVARFKATLCWNDTPAMPNASKSLVNDLDLRVMTPDGVGHQPWVLNTAPIPDSLALPAQTGRDTLNTVEQVVVENPVPGAYRIVVSGSHITSLWQEFGIVFSRDTLGNFEWTYPLSGYPAASDEEGVLRWATGFPDQFGRLDWKSADAMDWLPIADSVDLASGWYKWLFPDTFLEAQVRMRIGNHVFVSDTFLIAPELRLQVGYNCPDSVLLFWSQADPQSTYRFWGLGDRYMEPLMTTSDTFLVLGKNDFMQVRFAVSAIGKNGVEGPRCPAPDINQQATGCFINRLLAFLTDGDQADLNLYLSTLYRIDRIRLEKQVYDGSWTTLTEQPPEGLNLEYTDSNLHPGVNTYRAIVQLVDGGSIESEHVFVYNPGPAGALVLPNPANSEDLITIISRFVEGTPRFVLYDMTGKTVLDKEMMQNPELIYLPRVPHGLYFWTITENGRRLVKSGKLVIQPR